MPEEGRNRTRSRKSCPTRSSLVDRKKALIADLLKQDEAASFDETLAKLDYRANPAKPKRSHHKKAVPPSPDPVARLGPRPKA
jgi:hypothetical protein